MSSSVSIHGPSGRRGVEALGPGPLQVRLLDVAGGEVVAAGVAEDDVIDALLGDVLADPADDDAELGLEGDVLGELRQDDRIVGPDHGGVGLEEQQRLRRDLVAEFPGVLREVAADADDLAARDDRRQQAHVLQLVPHGGSFHAVEEGVAVDDSDFLTAGLTFHNAVEGIRIDYKPGDTHGS